MFFQFCTVNITRAYEFKIVIFDSFLDFISYEISLYNVSQTMS